MTSQIYINTGIGEGVGRREQKNTLSYGGIYLFIVILSFFFFRPVMPRDLDVTPVSFLGHFLVRFVRFWSGFFVGHGLIPG